MPERLINAYTLKLDVRRNLMPNLDDEGMVSVENAERYFLNLIDKQPTADVAEVRRGYNKTSMHPVDEFWCSECGFCCADYTETKYDADGDYTYSCECEFDYCPRCGARMDGGRDT